MTNLLPLDDFRRVLGWHPWHFWGLADNDLVPVSAQCKDLLKQHAWQGTDYCGRDEILAALESAESLLRDYLGFAVAPEYRAVTVNWPRYYDTARDRWAHLDATGRWISVLLPFGAGQLQALGVELLTLVDTVTVAGADLVFSDSDADGLSDTFTATATVPAGTDPDQVGVYFAAADRLDGESAGERWRIRPVSVSVSGTTATLVGRLWLLVRPVKYEAVNVQPLDPTDLSGQGPYAQSLEIYTRVCNPAGTTVETAQANVIWETTPCHGWWCCCGSCVDPSWSPTNSPADPAATATAMARAGIRDARLGRVSLGEAAYNATTGVWTGIPWSAWREPDRAVVRIYAGQPLAAGGQFTADWRRTIARLAMAEMPRPLAACESANRELGHWQFDVSLVDGRNEEKYQVSDLDLNNPFGTRRGHIFAWRQVRNLCLTPATIDS